MIEELEEEINETRFIAQRAGGGDLKSLEEDNKKLKSELSALKATHEELTKDLGSHNDINLFYFLYRLNII